MVYQGSFIQYINIYDVQKIFCYYNHKNKGDPFTNGVFSETWIPPLSPSQIRGIRNQQVEPFSESLHSTNMFSIGKITNKLNKKTPEYSKIKEK